MSKKLIGGVIGLVVVAIVVGLGVLLLCGRDSGEENSNNGGNVQMGNEVTGKTTGKTLVVYYSASGNTKRVAEKIAASLGADTFEIVPAEVYTEEDLDWTGDSRVSREHEDVTLREVTLVNTTVPDWASYETVFIGYPIWWGIAAWPVDGFVKANDFSGKTVIPFATSASSGLGQSGELLKEMAGSGDWLEGMRFSSHSSDDEIKAWVDSLE